MRRNNYPLAGIRTPWLKEGGKGAVPIAFHFQLRPTRSPIDGASRRARQK
jgi:hypothetical protein